VSVRGKVALVTGAGAGLGRAVALRLAADGARVVAVSIEAAELDEVRAAAAQDGLDVRTVEADVGDASRCAEVTQELLDRHIRLDVLVNNAGVIAVKPLEETSPDVWDRVLSTNLRGAYLYTRAFVPSMKQSGGGLVINVSSASGIRGFVDESAYCASKFGLEGLTAALALELQPWNIRLASISPGAPMRTPMSETTYDDTARRSWIDPEEIAPGFSLLAACDEAWVSGRRFDAYALATHGMPAPEDVPSIASLHEGLDA
jgi:NAD(P)-dependent dehydrogenase (short-subunit alcohol dehydrogenase family)